MIQISLLPIAELMLKTINFFISLVTHKYYVRRTYTTVSVFLCTQKIFN